MTELQTVFSAKQEFTCYEYPPGYDAERIVQERGVAIGEAADMYGNLETAEDYGYVERGYA